MPERLTLAPGVEVPAPEDGSVLRYSGEAVQDVLDFFSLLCFAQNEWAGKPFELLPWEEEAVRQFYGIQVQDEDGLWVRYRRYLYDELPKKNGKTELAAGLGLYHLLYDGEERPRVGVFSSDKENASQIYEAAKYMVENTSLGQPEHDPIAWAWTPARRSTPSTAACSRCTPPTRPPSTATPSARLLSTSSTPSPTAGCGTC